MALVHSITVIKATYSIEIDIQNPASRPIFNCAAVFLMYNKLLKKKIAIH